MYHRYDGGWIEVICGSMFSGKTEELIRRLKRAEIARQKVQVFKPALDSRYQADKVSSHSGSYFEANVVNNTQEIAELVEEDTDVVAIDEVQFFDDNIIDVIQQLANDDVRVIVAGLDLDFRGEPFGTMPELLCIAEEVTKLRAICVICGESASRTQRLVNGQPAHYDDPVILVGAEESYEARCRLHHVVLHGERESNQKSH